MNWLAFGYCVIAAMVLAGVAALCVSGIRALLRRSTAFFLVFTAASSLTTITAQKTNNVNNLPPQQMMAGGWASQTGFTELTGLAGALPLMPSSLNPVNLVNPVQNNIPVQTTPPQQTFASRWAANWNVRGAWKDSFWLSFKAGWVFPHGTNHLSGVEVVSQGMVWPTPFDANAVASAGEPVEIVPGLSSFGYELTPSNSYRLVWTDAAINRDTNNLVSASIELFRNGDLYVTTNGIESWVRRELPFPHSGFGQDDEWVTANFTNAAEILSMGYSAWVDAQVGTGLTNGLYKLTVTLACDPPETTFLSVDDLMIAATNAGEYVFLVEKGPAYDLTVFPASSNVTVSAVDDIAAPERGGSTGGDPGLRHAPLRSGAVSNYDNGTWTPDGGTFWTDYASGVGHARFWWLPCFCGSPDVSHIDSSADAVEFQAVLSDYRGASPSFTWTATEGLDISEPNSQTTEVTADGTVSWNTTYMAVTASFGEDRDLTSYINLSYGTNDTPQAGVSVSVPRVMFANDDDDNGDSTNDYERVDFGIGENDVAEGSVAFSSDVGTNGVVRVWVSDFPGDVYTNSEASAQAFGGFDVAVEGDTRRTVDLYFNPLSWSQYQNPSVTAVWIPEGGEPQTSSVPFTVVKSVAEPICAETVEHSALGTNHVYVLNPSGVAVGDDAYFRVKVSPNTLPDSEISWTNRDGRVAIVGGNTGRCVHVRGVSPGDAELEVVIGGRTIQVPTFTVKVVTPQTVKITAWIVGDAEGNGARQVDDVQNMISPLNDIYRQVGFSFYLDSVTVTNIPDAFDLTYDSTTNGGWNFDRLVDIGQNTGGIECYFVNDILCKDGNVGPVGANSSAGLVLTSLADVRTLSHEIGHAFGLCDVYVSAREKDEYVFGENAKDVGQIPINSTRAPADWNGGCCGFGDAGARYYQGGTKMATVIPRLVMYGIASEGDVRLDITAGSVDGVWYLGEGAAREWYDSSAQVGFFDNPFRKGSPCHD